MNIITGYRGEPHITAQEDRDINLGVVGNSLNDVYVLDVGQKLEADIVTANEIRIRDGIMIMQGCAASIDYGAYDSIEISNGTQGMQRIDIIAAQYEKDADTSIEDVSLVVVEGTPDAGDPQPPTLTGGDLQGGDTFIQMPLYYVNLDGVSIDSIEAQYKMATNLDWCTLSDATQAKWNDIAGGASNDAIMDYTASALTPVKTTFTPTTGQPHDAWGGCWYKVCGRLVQVHIGVNSITGSWTGNTIYTMPVGLRPPESIDARGSGQTANSMSQASIGDTGVIRVYSANTYANVVLMYFI